jgi:hypothetical protein
MASILKMTNDPVPSNLTLIAGSTYPFKVSGFGPDKKHVLIKCSSPTVKVVVVQANERNIEQTLRLEFQACISTKTQATLAAYWASKPAQKDLTTPEIALTIEPRLELPPTGMEAGILARVLIVENITPGQRQFSMDQSLTAMKWMRVVLVNRLSFGSQYFDAGKSVSTLTELIKAPNQVAGFENYPIIATANNSLLNEILSIANNSAHKDCLLYRQYVQNAIDVANLNTCGSDPCPTGLYAWRTANSGSPGDNFVKYQSLGGQDFYTLSEAFRKDPLLRKHN